MSASKMPEGRVVRSLPQRALFVFTPRVLGKSREGNVMVRSRKCVKFRMSGNFEGETALTYFSFTREPFFLCTHETQNEWRPSISRSTLGSTHKLFSAVSVSKMPEGRKVRSLSSSKLLFGVADERQQANREAGAQGRVSSR